MKKIAIQTLTPNDNYGGILQAFALQQILKLKGFDVVTLNTKQDFRGWEASRPKTLLRKIKFSLRILLKAEARMEYKLKQKKTSMRAHLERHFKQYLSLSPLLPTYSDWCDYIKQNKIDILIAGSDQIWRLEYNREQILESYLVYNDTPVKKISYAASLGVSVLDEELKNLMQKYLPSFDAISVRELDSVELLSEIGIKSQVCLDPTLLLSDSDYIKLFDLKKTADVFAFSYILDKNNSDENIKSVLPDINLEIKKIDGDMTYQNFDDPNFHKPLFTEWLQYIYSSKMMITDSFHGMVFSIIFKKPFYVRINKERGASRFISLLSQLDLMDRIWDGSKITYKEIDYTPIYEKLQILKEKSMDFLNSNLNTK